MSAGRTMLTAGTKLSTSAVHRAGKERSGKDRAYRTQVAEEVQEIAGVVVRPDDRCKHNPDKCREAERESEPCESGAPAGIPRERVRRPTDGCEDRDVQA